MAKTHWKKLTNPNYLGVYSLEEGKDIILTIKYIQEETVTGTDGKKEKCPVCHFQENVKPMIFNVTNLKTLAELFGSYYVEDWVGKQIQIGAEKVKAFGEVVDALRVRKTLPNSEKFICSDCGAELTAFAKFTPKALAEYTYQEYGAVLCSNCATKRKQARENEAEQ